MMQDKKKREEKKDVRDLWIVDGESRATEPEAGKHPGIRGIGEIQDVPEVLHIGKRGGELCQADLSLMPLLGRRGLVQLLA